MGCKTVQLHLSVLSRSDSQNFLSAARGAMLRDEPIVAYLS